ncbi:FirrV-1-K1 [Feldmannia irregularis virus a]|uniref:FirrV-1-K1 n=1 Tax=Feldmannia irregularis virus a TaxID=231992 RepID=Q6XLT8_9PHYC|nr:FirrV-1-K1 [Feldmannia irregularis virus a]AAR26973.1 FirrV-1-K1 [Feldmannia irregularis virus a]
MFEDSAQGTKSSLIQQTLRSLNIQGSIRVDEVTGLASAIDVIRLICPDQNEKYASHILKRIIDQDADKEKVTNTVTLSRSEHSATIKPPFSERVKSIKINGKGHTTPVADVATLVEIIWLIPGSAVRQFRAHSAEALVRALGGDLAHAREIAEHHIKLQETPEGREFQDFMLPDRKKARVESVPDTRSENYILLSLVTDPKEKSEMVKKIINQQLKNRDVQIKDREVQIKDREVQIKDKEESIKGKSINRLIGTYQSLKDLGVTLDERTFMELRDNVSIINKVHTKDRVVPAVTGGGGIDRTVDPSVPTHELGPDERGEESGIVPVSIHIGVRVPQGMSGVVGKRMKKLYVEKYKLESGWNDFVKRRTLFRGRPITENVYFARDDDIIAQAIREVVCTTGK